MHNLHFVIVSAKTGEEACGKAENFMSYWGDEDNWRCFCGAVSENNDVCHSDAFGRYQVNESNDTIEKINNIVIGWINRDNIYNEEKQFIDDLIGGKIVFDSVVNDINALQTIEVWANQKIKQLRYVDGFDVLTQNFEFGEFDECGVTNIIPDDEFCDEADGEDYEDDIEDTNIDYMKWVVFVDVHS